MSNSNVIDLSEILEGSRFAVTFLDYANREDALPDEFMVDKEGEHHTIYYKNKKGVIVKVLEGINIIDGKLQTVSTEMKRYADSLLDRQLNIARLVHYKYTINITSDNTTKVKIPLETYSETDMVLVTTNSVMPSDKDARLGYSIAKDGTITFKTPLDAGMSVFLVIFKNIPVGPEGSFDGKIIKNGSLEVTKLGPTVIEYIDKKIPRAGNINVLDKTEPKNTVSGDVWFQMK